MALRCRKCKFLFFFNFLYELFCKRPELNLQIFLFLSQFIQNNQYLSLAECVCAAFVWGECYTVWYRVVPLGDGRLRESTHQGLMIGGSTYCHTSSDRMYLLVLSTQSITIGSKHKGKFWARNIISKPIFSVYILSYPTPSH